MIHELPILPTPSSLLFPNVARSIALSSPSTVAAARAAYEAPGRRLVTVAERTGAPSRALTPLYGVGTYAVITRLVSRASGVEVIVQGLERAAIERTSKKRDHLAATIRTMPLSAPRRSSRSAALEARVVHVAAKLLGASPDVAVDFRDLAERVSGTARIWVITAMLGLGLEKEQGVLEASTGDEALERLHAHLTYELEVRESRRAHGPARSSAPGRSWR